MAAVLFADQRKPKPKGTADSALITTTKPANFADFYALPAIEESAYWRTIQKG
jgi:hypothetical protein